MSPQDSLKMLWHVTITPRVPIPPTCTRESSTWKPNWATCPQHPHPLCKPDRGWNPNNCPQLRKHGMCPLVMKWLPGILLLVLQQVALQVCFYLFFVFMIFRFRQVLSSLIFKPVIVVVKFFCIVITSERLWARPAVVMEL